MTSPIAIAKWTLEDYHQMIAAGILSNLARIKGGEKDSIMGERHDHKISSEPID